MLASLPLIRHRMINSSADMTPVKRDETLVKALARAHSCASRNFAAYPRQTNESVLCKLSWNELLAYGLCK